MAIIDGYLINSNGYNADHAVWLKKHIHQEEP